MKRKSELQDRDDNLTKKLDGQRKGSSKLKAEISYNQIRLSKELLAESEKDQQRFLDNVLIPPIRRYPFDTNPFDQDNEDVSYLVSLLSHMPDLASHIWSHLGPMELSNTLRVCTYFEKLTTSVFLAIAPQLLDLYIVGTEKEYPESCVDKHYLTNFIQTQRTKQTTPTGTILKAWFAYFLEYRRYSTEYNKSLSLSFDHIFVVDIGTQQCARVNEINIYKVHKYERIAKACLNRLEEREGLSLLPSINQCINYFNYDEICQLNMSVPQSKGNPKIFETKNYVVIRSPPENRIEFFNNANLRFYPVSVDSTRSEVFFDMYEMSLSVIKYFYFFDKSKRRETPSLEDCMKLLV